MWGENGSRLLLPLGLALGWRWVVKLGTMQGVVEEEKQAEEHVVVDRPWCGGVVKRPTRQGQHGPARQPRVRLSAFQRAKTLEPS